MAKDNLFFKNLQEEISLKITDLNNNLLNIYSEIQDINSKMIKDFELYVDEGVMYNYLEYLEFSADEVKDMLFDPTACLCPIRAVSPTFIATAGPIIIDVYIGTIANDDGTPFYFLNRNAYSSNVSKSIGRINPTIINDGVRVGGRLVPASGLNPSTSTPAETTKLLPIILDSSYKWLFRMTNNNGNGVYVEMDFNFVEV